MKEFFRVFPLPACMQAGRVVRRSFRASAKRNLEPAYWEISMVLRLLLPQSAGPDPMTGVWQEEEEGWWWTELGRDTRTRYALRSLGGEYGWTAYRRRVC